MTEKNNINKKEKVEKNSIHKEISKNSSEINLNLDLIQGTEAYYSERYGWTLRKIK